MSDRFELRPTPPLPCPECRHEDNLRGGARIGNRRGKCTTCNNFAQNVRRLALKRLKERYPEEYLEVLTRAEMDLYPQVIEEYVATHPLSRTRRDED